MKSRNSIPVTDMGETEVEQPQQKRSFSEFREDMIPTFILGPVIIGASSNITSLGSIVRVAIRPRPAFFVITKSIGASPVIKDCFSVLQSSFAMLK